MSARRLSPRFAASLLVAVAAALAVLPLKAAIVAQTDHDPGFIPAMAAVVLAAWLGGFVPGILATILGMLIEVVVFMEPRGSFAVEGDRLRLALFGLTGTFASWLAWLRTRAEAQAHAASVEATRERARSDIHVRRTQGLQALAQDLSRAASTAEICDVLLARGVTALRADGAAVFLADGGEGTLQVQAWRGYAGEDERVATLGSLPIDAPMPATDAARDGVSVFLEDPADYRARYGPTMEQYGIPFRPRAVAAVPLEVEGRRFGALGFTWDRAHKLPEDRREYILTVAGLGAAALDRARLFDAERAALQRAASSQQRLDLLAEASRTLTMSLDYEATLRRLAGIALPLLGDLGIVDVLDETGVRRLVTTADDGLAAAAGVMEARPLQPAGGGPIAEVLLSSRASTIAVDDPTIAAAAQDPEHAAAIAELGARWALIAPIRGSYRTIGTLTFLRLEERPYDDDEVALASELGDRAGRALENARLHSQIQRLAAGERRRAGELEAIIAAIGEGIVVTGPDGATQSSNRAADRLLGGAPTSVRDLLDRLLDASGERPDGLPGSPVEYRLAARPTSWVEITSYPVAEAGEAGPSTVIVCRDVTAFRQGQALREAFLGLLSHELRTPVTTIYGGAAVLTRPGAATDPSTTSEILTDIVSEADRLYRLVEDLLVLARFDEGIELGDEPVLLQRVVPTVVAQERVRWPSVAFDVDVEPDLPVVRGDETSVVQVLRNLLSNAAKYSDAGSTVTVAVEREGDGVAVRVLDQGPGVSPGEVEHIFDPFYRSPATAKMAGGAGIGLFVSRRLVDAMGGRIWAAPRGGGGSEFTLILPPYGSDLVGSEVSEDDPPMAVPGRA